MDTDRPTTDPAAGLPPPSPPPPPRREVAATLPPSGMVTLDPDATVSAADDVASGVRHLPPAPEIPGYRILGRLGEGGMGVVWKAEQAATRRVVALKVIGAAAAGSAHATARFRREVELAAGLEHQNIARVYDSGVDRGAWYYAMEWVDGVPLDRYLRGGGGGGRTVDRRHVVATMATVARAVQFAHQRGVIHRDLKPSNVMVARDGAPKLLDFGLAKAVGTDAAAAAGGGDAPRVSVAGAVLGTIVYMAPEQARGEVDAVDTRSDVYTLGVILFEMLTGRLPHDTSGTPAARLRRIGEQEIPRPRATDPSIDAELEAVLLKAMALDADDRYASAGELSADLERYLVGDLLLARPHTTLYFIKRRVLRYRWQTAGVLTAVVAVAVASVLYVRNIAEARAAAERSYQDEQRQRQRADLAALRAEEQGALALATVKDLVFSAQNAAADDGSPATPAQLRKRLIDLAVGNLDRIAQQAQQDPPDLDRTSAAALAQVGATLAEAGRVDEARQRYSDAAARLERVVNATPRVGADPAAVAAVASSARNDLVVVRTRLARLHLDRGELARAEAELAAARAALAPLPAAWAGRGRNAWALAILEGDLRAEQGRPADAARAFETALSELGPAATTGAAEVAGPTPSSQTARDRALTVNRLAKAWVRAALAADAHPEERRSAGRRAIDLLRPAVDDARALAAAQPASVAARSSLATLLSTRAEAAALAGDPAAAAVAADEVVDLLRGLVAKAPDRPALRCDLASALFTRATVRAEAGLAAAARADLDASIDLLEALGKSGDLAGNDRRHAALLDAARRRRRDTEPGAGGFPEPAGRRPPRSR